MCIGKKAAAVVVRMEQRQLLAAVHPVRGVVDIEQNASRHFGETVVEKAYQCCYRQPLEPGRLRQVLEAAHGRL